MAALKKRFLLLSILFPLLSTAQERHLKLVKEISSFERGNYQIEHLGPNCLLGDTLFIADNRRVLAFTKEGKFLYQWGNCSLFSQVTRVCSDPEGFVYTLDFHHSRISKFDRWGKLLLSWRTNHRPSDVQCDLAGNVYVSEYEQILKYDPNGKLLRKWGSHGSAEGQFYWPVGLAFDDQNCLYVADEGNYRIQKFDTAGHFLLSFETKKFVYQPKQIAIRDTILFAMDERFLAEFNLNGRFLRKIEFGFMSAKYSQLSVDKNHHLFLNDYNKFYHLDQEGKAIAVWGNKANDETGFRGPTSMAGLEDGQLLVIDHSNHLKLLSDNGQIIVLPESKSGSKIHLSGADEMVYDKKTNSIYAINGYLMKVALKTGTKGLEELSRTQSSEGNIAENDFVRDICQGEDGEYYALYPAGHRIVAINENLEPLYQWGTAGDSSWQLKQPQTVGYFQGKVYVGDNGQIKLFDRKGNFQDSWPLSGNLHATDIKFDKSGNVYVIAGGPSTILVLSKKGKLIAEQKLDYIDFCIYTSIHVDTKGRIYVTREHEDRILVYELSK